MTESMWTDEYELIAEEYSAGRIDRSQASSRLTCLGFDPDEIDNHLGALDEDRAKNEGKV